MKATKKFIITFLAVVCLALCLTVSAFASASDITYLANTEDANTIIHVQKGADGKNYLFLPSSADLENIVLYFGSETVVVNNTEVKNGVAFDLTAVAQAKNGEYTLTFTDGTTLTVMKSANVRAIFYVSDDPVNSGREWVDAVKGNEAKGNMSVVGLDGEVEHTDKITEIKARGNSTFTRSDKKAYQFKLDKKVDLINNNKDEANKKWILLANMFDATLIHNSITFQLAMDLNMPYVPNYEAIDLYYDGEYRGAYLLCEKTEVDSSRIDIDDTDKAIENLNEDTDAYENPVVVTKTTASKGATNAAANSKGSYKYIQGLREPELPDGASHHAYLLELEFVHRYPEELSGFVTNRNQGILTKNPEYLTKESGAFISAFWQEFEDAVYSANGYNSKTGKYYYDYCDLDSLVKLYLINELSKNVDGFMSSTYFYMPADEDVLYAGPVWDYDPCYGPGGFHDNIQVATANPENFYAVNNYLADGLIKIESFRNAVKKALNNQNGEFYLAVQNMIGDNGNVYTFAEQVKSSQLMNAKLWNVFDSRFVYVHKGQKVTFENANAFLNDFINERINWLSDTTSTWNGSNYSVPTDYDEEPEENLSFFERIIKSITDFFQAIADFFRSLFNF